MNQKGSLKKKRSIAAILTETNDRISTLNGIIWYILQTRPSTREKHEFNVRR